MNGSKCLTSVRCCFSLQNGSHFRCLIPLNRGQWNHYKRYEFIDNPTARAGHDQFLSVSLTSLISQCSPFGLCRLSQRKKNVRPLWRILRVNLLTVHVGICDFDEEKPLQVECYRVVLRLCNNWKVSQALKFIETIIEWARHVEKKKEEVKNKWREKCEKNEEQKELVW